MSIDEHQKAERERATSNVLQFIPRVAASKSKEAAPAFTKPGPHLRGRDALDNDDDPGPPAA